MCKSVMVLFVFVMTFFEDCFDFLGTNSPFIAVTKQSGNSWFSSTRKLTFCRRRALAFSGHRVWFSEEQEAGDDAARARERSRSPNKGSGPSKASVPSKGSVGHTENVPAEGPAFPFADKIFSLDCGGVATAAIRH